MATRTTSKQAARRAKTTAVDNRPARTRRAKAPAPAAAELSLAWRADAAPAEVAPYPRVAVDVLWAAAAFGTTRRFLSAPNAAPVAEASEQSAAPVAEASEPSAAPAAVVPAPERNVTLDVESPTPARSEPANDTAAPPAGAEREAGRHRRIALRAYAIAEASGFRAAPFDAWLRAEREIVAAERAAG